MKVEWYYKEVVTDSAKSGILACWNFTRYVDEKRALEQANEMGHPDFMCICGGIDWVEVCMVLKETHLGCAYLLIVYFFFVGSWHRGFVVDVLDCTSYNTPWPGIDVSAQNSALACDAALERRSTAFRSACRSSLSRTRTSTLVKSLLMSSKRRGSLA